jgi:hypothetical protein
MRDILSTNVEPDGLVFDASTIRTERIAEDADYEGGPRGVHWRVGISASEHAGGYRFRGCRCSRP